MIHKSESNNVSHFKARNHSDKVETNDLQNGGF